ncbi:GntR family transcriptional regulator [Nonomuraea sp. NPDC059023]|uniref:GntR family transcriptional regulator n=1 Tax=unclassified Nonomuraea TaxID=2593643 RepID=UPI0036C0CC89
MAEGYKYEDIAAALISGIESGDYPPGAQLPSEADLREQFGGASPATVRRALQVLHDAGLTRAERARGVYVRSYDRAVVDETFGGGTSGHPIHTAEVTTMHAPRHVADLLLGGEADLVVRRSSTRVPNVRSYYPRWLVERLPELGYPNELQEDDRELMKRAGLTVVARTAEVVARMPTRQEMRDLGLGPGTPVMEVFTILEDNAGAVMAVREALYPADRYKLRLNLR